ncbi:DUF456 domain-containing protein [uncultured Bacteroides sp.]|uniref:DUF456 domain-containing protein n=1 Tax=uncultured Bacteroides sp. TaxID=162156 RepID=UPI0025FD4781|nr:DUF456 domain-containing protein [uncultured Bacteroides sp.]
MLDILLMVISALCLLVGLVGCIVPMLPGPPVAYIGLLILHFTDKVEYTVSQLTVWLLLVVVLQVLDYFTPMLGSKYSGGSKWGNRGCIVGTLAGLLFLPWGILVGPFLGALIGELLGNKEFSQALKSGFGSLVGFMLGTLMKLLLCGYFCYQFIAGLIWGA